MPSAGLIEMPPVSNVIPFADEAQHRAAWSAGRIVAKHHQPRRLAAPTRDAQEQAHPEGLDLLLVEHFDGHARLAGHGGRPRGKLSRRQRVARLVRQRAGGIAAFAEDTPTGNGRLNARARVRIGSGLLKRDRQPRRGRGRRLPCLVAAAVELGKRQPLGDGLSEPREVQFP